MPYLHMDLLGGFRAILDGTLLITFESNKVRALLTYLATESNRSHPRESLAALLWPDWPDRAAMSNLRYALSDLRKVIGDREAEPPFLFISREAIQFNPESDHALDVAEFSRLASAQEIEALQKAVSFYQGDFLDGFSVSEAAPFEDWTRLKSEQLRRCYLEALHRLGALLEIGGELEHALAYAHRLVDAEPLDESAQRRLMRLLALSGRRAEALVQYEACREVLTKELGAEPSGETARLHAQIQTGQLEAEVSAFRLTTPQKLPAILETYNESTPPVFVAREQELWQLNRLLEDVLDNKGRLSFVTGGAGRGKTALLHEFARQASEAHPDLLLAAGSCNPYSGVSDPYLPLRSVLRILMGNIELAGSTDMISRDQAFRLWQGLPCSLQALIEHGFYLIDTFLPGYELLRLAEARGVPTFELLQMVEQAASRSSKMVQEHLFEQYCAVLRALSREHPLLILLDDLQWADSASAGLLYHLGKRLEGSRILLLCAYRPEEIALGREGERHPLEKALAEFKRLYGDAWLDLAISDERGGRRFVDVFLDSEPNRLGESFRQQLFQHTEGHALFTTELLRAMQERGDLVKDQDRCWVEGAFLDWQSLPTRVEAVIAERIGWLEQGQREMLSIASVEGQDFTVQVIARVQQVNERQLLHALSEEMEKRHLLVREQGELHIMEQTLWRYRFAHTLYQQYLYNHLGGHERRLLHRSVAKVLEELYVEHANDIAPQLAYHWQQAKDTGKAMHYTLLAGLGALEAFANSVAEGYFRQVLEMEPTNEQRATALSGLGDALRREAKREEAAKVLRQGIDLYRHLGDLDGMARLYHHLSVMLFQENHLAAWNVCQEGLSRVGRAPDSPGLAYLLAETGRTALFLHNTAAEDFCRRAIEMAKRLGVVEVQAEATITLAMIIDLVYGLYKETIQMLEQIVPFCEMYGLKTSFARAHMNLGVWLNKNYLDAYSAYQHYLQAAKIFRQIGDVDAMFLSLDNVMDGYRNLGNLTTVESMAAEFLKQSNAPKERIAQFFEKKSGELLFFRGEWEQSREHHRAWVETYRTWHIFQAIAECNYFLAWDNIELHCLTGSGDLSEAEAALLENLEMREWIPASQTILVKVYSLQGRFAEAHALLFQLFGASPKFQLEAKANHALGERRWNRAAPATQSLINYLQSIGRRWEWARALIDLGDIYSQRNKPGDLERASDAYQQSLEMFSEMEAAGYIQVLHQRLEALRRKQD